jgi:hypothetical protein
MKRIPIYTPSVWRVAPVVVITAIMGLADAWRVTDPVAIMRRTGARLTLAPHRKTA